VAASSHGRCVPTSLSQPNQTLRQLHGFEVMDGPREDMRSVHGTNHVAYGWCSAFNGLAYAQRPSATNGMAGWRAESTH
jgi:hypothetical protein